MLHDNSQDFIKLINATAMQTGFLPVMLEKDYYLTLVLSKIQELSNDLIFKGGTCLNKVYFDYQDYLYLMLLLLSLHQEEQNH